MKKILDLHKKMYDIRWHGSAGDFNQIEQELFLLAEKENIDLEKVNELQHQLYIPPYQEALLPDHLKNSHGGKREGAGRPSLGTTKKISVTLPDDIWDAIDRQKGEQSMSSYFRELAMKGFKL